jgi:uncharacterized phage-associated protein
MIRFQFNPRKFASAAAYIAERKSPVTKKELCKLIFFADQRHLLNFGRTITGDKYNALPQGPVPSHGLDMLNDHHDAPRSDIETMREFGRLQGRVFRPARLADRSVFSRSDIRTMDEVIAELGQLSAAQLEELSHKEAAWERTSHAQRMDFDLFFEGHPEFEGMRSIVNTEHAESER